MSDTPVNAPDAAKPPAEKEGLPWRELLADKTIDIVLIPLGLFLALWFQGWVDDRKELGDYVAQLESFRTEIHANREKCDAMGTQIGPLDARTDETVLGPLGNVFPRYDKVLAYSADRIECLEMTFAPMPKAPTDAELAELAKTEEGREQIKADIEAGDARTKRLEECDAPDKDSARPPPAAFVVVDLSPLYRYEVWQMYLQDGIKLFKDEEARVLGRSLGEAYALAREVETRVAEIEDAYNNELTTRFGAEDAVQAEVEHLLEVSGGTEDKLGRYHQLAFETRRERYSMLSFRSSLATKVGRLKGLVADMATRFDALDKAIAAEIARNQ